MQFLIMFMYPDFKTIFVQLIKHTTNGVFHYFSCSVLATNDHFVKSNTYAVLIRDGQPVNQSIGELQLDDLGKITRNFSITQNEPGTYVCRVYKNSNMVCDEHDATYKDSNELSLHSATPTPHSVTKTNPNTLMTNRPTQHSQNRNDETLVITSVIPSICVVVIVIAILFCCWKTGKCSKLSQPVMESGMDLRSSPYVVPHPTSDSIHRQAQEQANSTSIPLEMEEHQL